MRNKFSIVFQLVFLLAVVNASAQRTRTNCACQNSMTMTGSISKASEQLFKNDLKKIKYKTGISFQNNSDCTLEVISAKIDDKTVFVAKRIAAGNGNKANWLKDFIINKALQTNDGKVKVSVVFRQNTKPCSQEFLISVN